VSSKEDKTLMPDARYLFDNFLKPGERLHIGCVDEIETCPVAQL
jgi:hypothetical protein